MLETQVYDRLRKAGFEVYTRRDWGSRQLAAYADRASNPYYRVDLPLDYHFLHITVTPDTDTVEAGFAGVRQIEGYGYSEPPMVSYQTLVTNEAKVFQGQNHAVKGTHTVNDKGVAGFPHDLNRHGHATALMQNVGDEVTDEQVIAVAAVFAARELAGIVKRGARILPHRQFAWKSCPGDRAVARLAEIQRLKDKFVREGLPQVGDKPRALLPPILAANVTRQASLSPEKRKPNRRYVKFVQRALNAKRGAGLAVDGLWKPADRAAYAEWQRFLGYSGADADGKPGRASLRKLGRGTFRAL